ncbi:hypothetical protein [Marinagarivorans cellulosilyticus]|uniref:Uncharacterized protein n=1 Tax=Marinagarivorans cellulosilyticus TaxID=2721545 RepID=A0AAN1WHJ2_9GAMM|nr:hypothetical protein [Marinagarivorans cellulosilyticus]BCD97723.1 hypothetical protein MARGE09_P1924 [Marinagarivorans cellulosilyticus]
MEINQEITTYDQWVSSALEKLREHVDAQEFKGISLRISKKNTNISEYLQGVSELSPIIYFAESQVSSPRFPRRKGKYSKDIDISYLYNEQQINIEIKCPDSSKRLQRLKESEFNLYTQDTFPSKKEADNVIAKVAEGLDVGVAGNDIAKISGDDGFLKGCSDKFNEVSTVGDLNVILFSLSSLEELDEWRIKFEKEGVLKNHKNIHGIILSSMAYDHLRNIDGHVMSRLNLTENLNYIIQNIHHPKSIPNESMYALFSSFPNNTANINTWYSLLAHSPKDPLRMLDRVKLRYYYQTSFGE